MENNMWFCCERCENVDHMKSTPPPGNAQLLCFRCQFGSWHNLFAEETFDPNVHDVINKPSNKPFAQQNSFMGGSA